ncbi:SIR2 family protein [Treponema vincentii]|uniref:SIR2 family protein n=1 Tax=Treponema vincentii TaxID=69710 RepID=UPI0035F5C3A0
MDIVEFSDRHLQSELKNLFTAGNLIPFIGSGFSKGTPIYRSKNKVPDGSQLVTLMKNKIEEYAPERSKRVATKTKFSDVAKVYLKSVPRDAQLKVFSDYFVGVDFDYRKSAFLKAGWSYLYTLNIDDGIERILRDYHVVLPCKKLNTDYTKTHRCIYKLHGDAKSRITYKDEESIIFSSDQYLISLRDNADFISMIQSDYKTKSILMIGCSLDDELDIKFAVLTNDKFDNDINNRFYITHKEPDDEKKEILEDLGISKVILVENYDEFYDFFASPEVKANEKTVLKKYRFNGYTDVVGKDENINYYLGYYTIKDIMPKYKVMIEREKEIDEWEKIKNSNSVLIVGRRITGKTSFLINLLSRFAAQPIYFFSSDIIVSIETINELKQLTGCVFVFDSNSIRSDNLSSFIDLFNSLSNNDNKLIVTVNKSDRFFIALVNIINFDHQIEIDRFPTKHEVIELNRLTSEFGIPNISNKRSFIDNIAYLRRTIYKGRKSIFPEFCVDNITEIEVIVFILLASLNKVYYITLQHFDISLQYLKQLEEKYSPAIEIYRSFDTEVAMHSGIKLVANSKYWIIDILAKICRKNQEIVIGSLIKIISQLYFTNDSFYCARQVLLFDNFNAIFVLFDTGVLHIPYSVYEKVEVILKDEPDYWLQRAKGILRLSSRTDELKVAYEYAYKAFIDFETKEKYSEKAVLTLAMIAGKICKLNKYVDDIWIENAIDQYYEALISEKNINYNENLIAKAKQDRLNNDLYCFARYLFENTSKYLSRKDKVDEILTQLLFK